MTLTTEWRLSAPGGFGRRTSSPTRGTLPTSSNGTCHLCPRPSSNVTQLCGTVGAVVDDFVGTGNPSLIQQTIGMCGALPVFVPFHNGAPRRDRTGVPRSRTPSALPAKLTARALSERIVLVSTTATTWARPAPTAPDATDSQALHPARFLKSQSEQRAAVL